jgi:pimeloyl-ACP methyl ester carboxylesterase
MPAFSNSVVVMAQLRANGIQLEYDTFGQRSGRPLLLVMGLGAQMIHWRAEFCELLAAAGHYVIRFDNRDVGRSEKLDAAGVPNVAELLPRALAGEAVSAPYSLDDMADDAWALLDALDIEAAHICGASLGGMIVQTMAINAPQRVKSLTSIMSSTGNPELPPAQPEAIAALLSPPGRDRAETLERSVSVARVIGSPAYPTPEAEIRARAAEAFDRCFYPVGVTRQMAAAMAHGNRVPALRTLDVRALVIHGAADPLVPLAGGLDTHAALRGSRLLVIDGMGHDLPRQVWPQVVEAIDELTAS